MILLFNIADIPLYLKGNLFPKALYPIERKMLNPFIYSNHSNGNRKKQYIVVNTEIIDIFRQRGKTKLNHYLIKKLKSYFHIGKNEVFSKLFNYFVEKPLCAYLSKNPDNEKKFYNLLQFDDDYNKIIIQKNSFVLFDKTNSSYILVHNIFRLSASYLNNIWPYNLQTIKLLFRMILNSEKDGVILHASSCADTKGYGYVFIGPGNSGKSTVAKTLSFKRILSDDTTVIRRANNTYNIYPNPWWNFENFTEIHKPLTPARLKALFFITKADKTKIKKLNYKESLSRLIYGDTAFQQTGFLDNKTGIKNFYLFSQKLITDVPCFELRVKIGPVFKNEFPKLINRYLK